MTLPPLIQLAPVYRDYIWGGQRLRPGPGPTAEAWMIYEGGQVVNEHLPTGLTLAQAAAEYGEALLGKQAVARTGKRFSLLVKLLDSANWLSLQVHPDDPQAVELEGAGAFGKTEAWHVLEAAPGAQLIAGVRPGTDRAALTRAIQQGSILEWVQYQTVKAGDTVLMQPGTIHAIGPRLLLYEVQQSSNLTYRVYDWGRPQTPSRPLHVDKSLAVVRADAAPTVQARPPLSDGQQVTICQSRYFTLALLACETRPMNLDTQGESFHALTVIEGQAQVAAGGQVVGLAQYQSLLVPAAAGEYQVRPVECCRVLVATV